MAAGFANTATNPAKANEASLKGHSSTICERIVVMNKRDLVSEWGIEVCVNVSPKDILVGWLSHVTVMVADTF